MNKSIPFAKLSKRNRQGSTHPDGTVGEIRIQLPVVWRVPVPTIALRQRHRTTMRKVFRVTPYKDGQDVI